jgi:hypothetical protein
LSRLRSALGRLLHFAFDSPLLVPRYGLSTAKAVGTLVEEAKQVDLHFEWGRGFNKKDDTRGTFYRSTGLGSAMAGGRMPL